MVNENSLNIFIVAWGDEHLDLLERFTLPPMMWGDNLPACGLNDVYIDCYTKAGDADRLHRMVDMAFEGTNHFTSITIEDGEVDPMLIKSLRQAVIKARNREVRMFYLTPDTIFGNGSIKNIVRYSRNKNVVVGGGHLRIDRNSFLSNHPIGFAKRPVSNPDLVDLAMFHRHQVTADSFFGSDNGTPEGGISLTQISEEIISMVHHLPAPWLALFNDDDVRYFNSAPHAGAWDHDWPKTMISRTNEGRFRVMGSSDLFFAVEITRPERNRVPITPNSRHVESYFKGCAHHATCGHFVISLRGNGCNDDRSGVKKA